MINGTRFGEVLEIIDIDFQEQTNKESVLEKTELNETIRHLPVENTMLEKIINEYRSVSHLYGRKYDYWSDTFIFKYIVYFRMLLYDLRTLKKHVTRLFVPCLSRTAIRSFYKISDCTKQ